MQTNLNYFVSIFINILLQTNWDKHHLPQLLTIHLYLLYLYHLLSKIQIDLIKKVAFLLLIIIFHLTVTDFHLKIAFLNLKIVFPSLFIVFLFLNFVYLLLKVTSLLLNPLNLFISQFKYHFLNLSNFHPNPGSYLTLTKIS